jgi:hypothetical protein
MVLFRNRRGRFIRAPRAKYEQFTKPTRIGFSTQRRSIVARLIRWLTGSRASHVMFLYYDRDFSRDMLMEATTGGFRIVPFDKFSQQNTIVSVKTPKFSIDAGLLKAVDWLGEHYDYRGLLGMLVVLVGRWFKRQWKNPLASSKAMFCSEAVCRALKAVNYPGTAAMEPSTTDPEDLLKLFEAEECVS